MNSRLQLACDLIKELLNNLPDAENSDQSWEWCWDELSSDAQEAVKIIRRKASIFLKETPISGDCGEQPETPK